MTSAGLDLKNPGGKEMLVVGGAALGLGLIYFAFSKKKPATSPASPAPVSPVPASGHGLGAAPGNQSFLPGGASPTGNAFTDTLFSTPVTPSPGMSPVAPGPTSGPPTRMHVAAFPVQHVQQGAESILGPVSLSANTTALTPVAGQGGTTAGLSGSWQGSSLFTSPVSPVAWANSILNALAAPKTTANQQSLIAWALNEGGGGAYNPLNTTQGSQYPAFNGIGVRNYPNWTVGAQQTAATIRNGFYPNILAGLLSGKGIGTNAGGELHTWSGAHGYTGIAGNWQKAGAYVAAYVKAAQAQARAAAAARATKAASARQIQNLFPVVKPGMRAIPYRRRTPARRPSSWQRSINSAVAAIARAFQFRPPPSHPAYRPTPRRGPGHPLLH